MNEMGLAEEGSSPAKRFSFWFNGVKMLPLDVLKEQKSYSLKVLSGQMRS